MRHPCCWGVVFTAGYYSLTPPTPASYMQPQSSSRRCLQTQLDQILLNGANICLLVPGTPLASSPAPLPRAHVSCCSLRLLTPRFTRSPARLFVLTLVAPGNTSSETQEETPRNLVSVTVLIIDVRVPRYCRREK